MDEIGAALASQALPTRERSGVERPRERTDEGDPLNAAQYGGEGVRIGGCSRAVRGIPLGIGLRF